MEGIEVAIEYGLVALGLLLAPIGVVALLISALKRSKEGLLAAAACIALSAILLLRIGYAEFWQIDGCLDSGGGWNKETEECER